FGFLPGAAGFEGSFTNQDGSPDLQAGSHPYDFTTSLHLNLAVHGGSPVPDGTPKDIRVDLPAGFIGNPNVTTKCTPEQLGHSNSPLSPALICPVSSQVGVVVVNLAETQGIATRYEPVFNMV